MDTLFSLVPLIVFLPVLGLLINIAFGGKLSEKVIGTIASAAAGLAFLISVLLGAEKLPKGQVLPWQRPLAIGLAAVLLVEAGFLLYQRLQTTAVLAAPGVELNTTATLVTLGKALFTDYLLPFEVTSILLLVAMIGAIVLTKQVKGEQA